MFSPFFFFLQHIFFLPCVHLIEERLDRLSPWIPGYIHLLTNFPFFLSVFPPNQVSNLYIVSLAIADVIVGIFVMPVSALYIFTDDWLLGVAVCQIWMGVDYTASTASIFNLFILSLDRYWSVRQPLQYLHKRTKKRALTFITSVWAASCLWIFPIASWHHLAHGGVRTVPGNVCDVEYAKNMPFKLVTAFFNFYLPLTIMYILYFRVFREIRKRSEFEMGRRNPGGTVLSFKSHVTNNTSMSADISDGGDTTSSIHPCCSRMSSIVRMRERENGTSGQMNQGDGRNGEGKKGEVVANDGGRNRNVKLLSVKRLCNQPPMSRMESNPRPPLKVEYVYDENVIDPKTEKIERYFYEDHFPMTALPPLPSHRQRGANIELDSTPAGVPVFTSKSISRANSDRMLSMPTNIPLKFNSTAHSALSPFPISSSSSMHLNSSSTKSQRINPKISSRGSSISFHNRGFFRGIGNASKGKNKNSSCHCGGAKKADIYMTQFRRDTPYLSPVFSDINEVSSSSSASTFDDKGSTDDHDTSGSSSRRQRDSFSILSGIRKIRNAEPFLERTVRSSVVVPGPSKGVSGLSSRNGGPSMSKKQHRDCDGILVLHHDDRRVIGIKNRLKVKRPSSSLKKEIKAARQLGVIMGAFTLCFLPYFVLFMVVSFCDNCVESGLLTAATWIGYLNSTLNPFLYPLCNANFRIKFKSMLRCCSRSGSKLRCCGGGGNSNHDCSPRLAAISSRYD